MSSCGGGGVSSSSSSSSSLSSSAVVDVYVNGDGAEWSCHPPHLYRIPTELFDYYMMLGQLETSEDLQKLLDKIFNENITCAEDSYTNVYVLPTGCWSGSPSKLFHIPTTMFAYLLERGDTDKTIGRLYSDKDLEKLIDKISKEMETGVIIPREIVTVRTRPINIEVKKCGHECTISSLKETCCKCGDKRPIQEEGSYVSYIDGEGFCNASSRGAGYCPVCFY